MEIARVTAVIVFCTSLLLLIILGVSDLIKSRYFQERWIIWSHTYYDKYKSWEVFFQLIGYLIVASIGYWILKDPSPLAPDDTQVIGTALSYMGIIVTVLIAFIILVAQGLWDEQKVKASEILRSTGIKWLLLLVFLISLGLATNSIAVKYINSLLVIMTIASVFFAVKVLQLIPNDSAYILTRQRFFLKTIKRNLKNNLLVDEGKIVLKEQPKDRLESILFQNMFERIILEKFKKVLVEIDLEAKKGNVEAVEQLSESILLSGLEILIKSVPSQDDYPKQLEILHKVLNLLEESLRIYLENKTISEINWSLFRVHFIVISKTKITGNQIITSLVIEGMGRIYSSAKISLETRNEIVNLWANLANIYIKNPIQMRAKRDTTALRTFIKRTVLASESLLSSILNDGQADAFRKIVSSFANKLHLNNDILKEYVATLRAELAIRLLGSLNNFYLQSYAKALSEEDLPQIKAIREQYHKRKQIILNNFEEIHKAEKLIDLNLIETVQLEAQQIRLLQMIESGAFSIDTIKEDNVALDKLQKLLVECFNIVGSGDTEDQAGSFKFKNLVFDASTDRVDLRHKTINALNEVQKALNGN